MKYAPGEKPVINDVFYVPEKNPPPEKDIKNNSAAQPETASVSLHENKFKEGKDLFNLRQWDKSLKELLLVDAASFSNENRTELAYYLGLCCAKLERFDDALLYLEQVVTASADVLRKYQCRLTISYIYVMTKRPKMAEYELTRLQNAGFESAPLYNTLAYASYAQKRYQRAIEFYERALELDRNNATALNSMGYILADTGKDTAKGLRLCRKAVEINPQNAVYLDSLGWAHYKCGDIKDARSWLKRALELAPQMKEIKDHYKSISREVI